MLNTVALLRRHAGAHAALEDAMARGAPVGACIATVEAALKDTQDAEL